MRAWRLGDARRTLHLLTRRGLTAPRAMLAARAAVALGRPDAAYTLLGAVRSTVDAELLELLRAEAAEALGQLAVADAHAAAAGRLGALARARLARLGGQLEEARARLSSLGDHPHACLERATLDGDASLARATLPRLHDADACALSAGLAGGSVARQLAARSADPAHRLAYEALASGRVDPHVRPAAIAMRRCGRRWAFDLLELAIRRAGDPGLGSLRVARDGSWLERAGSERVSLRRRPRVRRALQALAENPDGIEPEALFDRVWDEPRPASGVLRNRVDVTLARLRATGLGEHLERRHGLVRLVGVDVAERVAS